MTVTATSPRQATTDDYAQRFLDKIGPATRTGCRLWTAASSRGGTPMAYDGTRTVSGRRYAWELEHGLIPPGVSVTVTCQHSNCLEIDHLALTDARPFSGRHRNRRNVARRYLQPNGGAWVLTVVVDQRLAEASTFPTLRSAVVGLYQAAQEYDQRG